MRRPEECSSRAPSASQFYSTLAETTLEKNKVGIFVLWLADHLCQCNHTSVIRFRQDPETKQFPRRWTRTGSLGPCTLGRRGDRLAAPQPLHLTRVHLSTTAAEPSMSWTSPRRQPLVTITRVSSYVSKLPTPQPITVPIRWLSRNVQPMVILPIRSFKGFTSRMAEWIKPNNP